jgi:ankyrin repeat protein
MNRWFKTAFPSAWSREVVEQLLETGEDPNETAFDFPYRRPLHYAAMMRSAEGVDALLKGGAEVDACDDTGDTPLHIAVCKYCRNEAVVKALLAHGADVNLRNNCGETVLTAAVPSSCSSVVESIPIFEALLAAGADAASLQTPLYKVLRKCVGPASATLASMLIRAGASVPVAGTEVASKWYIASVDPATWKVVQKAMVWPLSARCTWITACLALGFMADAEDAEDVDVRSSKRVCV